MYVDTYVDSSKGEVEIMMLEIRGVPLYKLIDSNLYIFSSQPEKIRASAFTIMLHLGE